MAVCDLSSVALLLYLYWRQSPCGILKELLDYKLTTFRVPGGPTARPKLLILSRILLSSNFEEKK